MVISTTSRANQRIHPGHWPISTFEPRLVRSVWNQRFHHRPPKNQSADPFAAFSGVDSESLDPKIAFFFLKSKLLQLNSTIRFIWAPGEGRLRSSSFDHAWRFIFYRRIGRCGVPDAWRACLDATWVAGFSLYELRNARQLSGQTIEIFGAHMPSMAADLGLTREPSEIFLPMLLILDYICL